VRNMIQPLTEEQKKQYLREGAMDAIKTARANKAKFDEIQLAARTVFAKLLTTPEWGIEEAPLPAGMATPFEQLWSVTPKVTHTQSD